MLQGLGLKGGLSTVKQVRWALVGCLAAVLVLVAVYGRSLYDIGRTLYGVLSFSPMRHDATNYDPELTRDARTALPIIAALNRYHSKHSAFPTHASQLAHYLPPGSARTIGSGLISVRGWHYIPDRGGKGYVLSVKIDWEAGFGYWYDGSKGHWIFSGVGSDGPVNKEIILRP
jgi:hypothetical protein